MTPTLRLAAHALTLADSYQTNREADAVATLARLAAGSVGALTLAQHDCFELDQRTETLWRRACAMALLELAAMCCEAPSEAKRVAQPGSGVAVVAAAARLAARGQRPAQMMSSSRISPRGS